MTLSDLAPTLAAVAAFLLLARGAGRRASGERFRLVLALLLLVWAAAWRLLFSGGLVQALVLLPLDLGVGLIAGSALLALRREFAGTFLVPGTLALLASGSVHGVRTAADHFFGDAPEPAVERVAGQLLLELGPDDRIEELGRLLERFGVRAERAFPELDLEDDPDLAQSYVLHGPDARLDELRRALREDAENVDAAEWNARLELVRPMETTAVPARPGRRAPHANDPRIAEQWALDALDAPAVYDLLRGAQPARKALVAILDTGVDGAHEDLDGAFEPSPGSRDAFGHGTHVAGLAGAATNNGIGIASFNWENRFIRLAGYKALEDNGSGNVEGVARAILDAVRDGADVISLSLGLYAPTPPKMLAEAVEFALRQGAIVVVSAGNSNQDARLQTPANIEGVIVVAASGRDGRRASFSNTTDGLARAISAPGVDILSLAPGDRYVPMSGTSMATPIVSGLLGVLRALDPTLTPEAAYDLLRRSGRAVPAGSGIGPALDPAAALREAGAGSR